MRKDVRQHRFPFVHLLWTASVMMCAHACLGGEADAAGARHVLGMVAASGARLSSGRARLVLRSHSRPEQIGEDDVRAHIASAKRAAAVLKARGWGVPDGLEPAESEKLFRSAIPWYEGGKPWHMVLDVAYRDGIGYRSEVQWEPEVAFDGAEKRSGAVVYAVNQRYHWRYGLADSASITLLPKDEFKSVAPEATSMLRCFPGAIPRRVFYWWRHNFAFLLEQARNVTVVSKDGDAQAVEVALHGPVDAPYWFKAHEIRLYVDPSRGGCVRAVRWIRHRPRLNILWTGAEFFEVQPGVWRPRKMHLVLVSTRSPAPSWQLDAEVIANEFGNALPESEFAFHLPEGRGRLVYDKRFGRIFSHGAVCQICPFAQPEAATIREMVTAPVPLRARNKTSKGRSVTLAVRLRRPPAWPTPSADRPTVGVEPEACRRLAAKCAALTGQSRARGRMGDLPDLYKLLADSEALAQASDTPLVRAFALQVMLFVYDRLNDLPHKFATARSLLKVTAEFGSLSDVAMQTNDLLALYARRTPAEADAMRDACVAAIAESFDAIKIAHMADEFFRCRRYALALRLYALASDKTVDAGLQKYCRVQLVRARWRREVQTSLDSSMPWEREFESRTIAMEATRSFRRTNVGCLRTLKSASQELKRTVAGGVPRNWSRAALSREAATIDEFLAARIDCSL